MKKHASLILALLVPAAMVLLIAATVYGPALFAKPPQYDFVFATQNLYGDTGSYYDVAGGRVVFHPAASSTDRTFPPPSYAPKLYRYSVRDGKTAEITFDEAKTLTLSTSAMSPDGYQVTEGSGGSGFPFGISTYGTRYLTGHNVSRKIDVGTPSLPYRGEFIFLGWITK